MERKRGQKWTKRGQPRTDNNWRSKYDSHNKLGLNLCSSLDVRNAETSMSAANKQIVSMARAL